MHGLQKTFNWQTLVSIWFAVKFQTCYCLSIFFIIVHKTNAKMHPTNGNYTWFRCMFLYLHDINLISVDYIYLVKDFFTLHLLHVLHGGFKGSLFNNSKQFNIFLIVICQGLFLHHAPYIFFYSHIRMYLFIKAIYCIFKPSTADMGIAPYIQYKM